MFGESLQHLWGEVAVILCAATLLHHFNLDNVFPFAGVHTPVSSTLYCSPLSATVCPSGRDVVHSGAQSPLFYSATPVNGSNETTPTDPRRDQPSGFLGPQCSSTNSLEGKMSLTEQLVLPRLLLHSAGSPLPHELSHRESLSRYDHVDTSVRLVVAYYLCEGRRSLEKDLEGVQSTAEGRASSDLNVLLQRLKEASDRLFPLLPLGRLSDYLVASEAINGNLDEAAKVAAQLLILVEDLYLQCAGEKPVEGNRGTGVSLGRLRALSSVFAEPSEEDRGHISFLESCLSNSAASIVSPIAFMAVEDALRTAMRVRPKRFISRKCSSKGILQRIGHSSEADGGSAMLHVALSGSYSRVKSNGSSRVVSSSDSFLSPSRTLVLSVPPQALTTDIGEFESSEAEVIHFGDTGDTRGSILSPRETVKTRLFHEAAPPFPPASAPFKLPSSRNALRSIDTRTKSTEVRLLPTTSLSNFGEASLTSSVTFAVRGNDVDDVELTSLVHRLNTDSHVTEVLVDSSIPSQFVVNDNLLFHVMQEVVQHNLGCGLPPSVVLLHRCGMHLVVDLVPQVKVPSSKVEKRAYCDSVHAFYTRQEFRMQALHSDHEATDLLSDAPPVTLFEWISSVLSYSRLQPNGSPTYHHSSDPSVPSFDSSRRVFGRKSSQFFDWYDTPAQGYSIPQPPQSTLSAHPAPEHSPDVWSVQAPLNERELQSLVAPAQYLSAGICELLVSLKAAVVLMSSGYASLAFPFISQERLDLLTETHMVHHPLSAAADLGIVELNRLADEATSEQQVKIKEERRAKVVSLQYATVVAPFAEELHAKSTSIPPLFNLFSVPGLVPSQSEEHLVSDDNLNSKHSATHSAGRGSPEVEWQVVRHCGSESAVSLSVTREALSVSSVPSRSSVGAEEMIRSGGGYDTRIYASMLGDPRANLSFADLSSLPSYLGSFSLQTQFPHIRALLYHATPCDSVIRWVLNAGHSLTIVTEPVQMCGFLRCGVQVYDVVAIEWTPQLMTQEILALLETVHKEHHGIPIFFFSITPPFERHTSESPLGDPVVPPLPDYVPGNRFILGSDVREMFFRSRGTFRASIRLWRILKDLKGDGSLRYQLRQRIGSGSFGDVYEVSLYASKGRLAMKRIPLGTITTERMEELYKEAMIMRELDHRNIVQLSHITCDDAYLNIFMELCSSTLKEVLAGGFSSGERAIISPVSVASFAFLDNGSVVEKPRKTFSTASVTPKPSGFLNNPNLEDHHCSSRYHHIDPMLVLRDVLGAVHYLHSHDIVHRDLKPQNILFLNGVAKLADFGSATTVSDRQNALRTMKGTMPYMAPEVFLGEPYRKSCDVWSLGILIGEILGIRFAHTALLHFPALQAYYKSLEPDESMPVVITNFISTGLKKHLTDELVEDVKAGLQEARRLAKIERKSANRPCIAGQKRCRSIMSITVDMRRLRCVVTPHYLPASLVELLESTFFRDPEKRVTVEELLKHSVANEKEWLSGMMTEVSQLVKTLSTIVDPTSTEDPIYGSVDLSFCGSFEQTLRSVE